MWPWEKRLADLASILESCHATYFEPILFNRNLNNFLQTSRTVSFLIQKNKNQNLDLEGWYESYGREKWKLDPIMNWAKDARNIIEKQGDLSIGSRHTATLIFSHFPENDLAFDLPKDHLIDIGTKKLIRIAQKKLPTGVSDTAVIKVERKWIDNNLSDMELLDAIGYVYKKIYICCQQLALKLETSFPSIADPEGFLGTFNGRSRVLFLKVNGLRTFSMIPKRLHLSGKRAPLPRSIKDAWKIAKKPDGELRSIFDTFIKIVEATFLHSSYHQPILILLGDEFIPSSHLTSFFADGADKFIFFRHAAEQVRDTKAKGAIFISEAWLRNGSNFPSTPIRNLNITGEQLILSVTSVSGETYAANWDIQREDGRPPTLSEPIISSGSEVNRNFFTPLWHAMREPG